MWIHDPGVVGTATYKWSRNNAATVSPIMNNVAHDASSLVVKDTRLFRIGDIIEISDDIIELSDKEDFAGLKPPTKRMGELRQIIDIDQDENKLIWSSTPSTSILRMTGGLVRGYTAEGADNTHPKVRKWDGADNKTTSREILLEDGVKINFSGTKEDTMLTGDYWTFTTRVNTREIEKLDNELPHGVVHRYCPLAVIEWDENGIVNIEDKRVRFEPLCGLAAADIGFDRANMSAFGEDVKNVQQAIESIIFPEHLTGGSLMLNCDKNQVIPKNPWPKLKCDKRDMVFLTGDSSTERMRIKADGNVGIGTTNPGAKLEVTGDNTNPIFIVNTQGDKSEPRTFTIKNNGKDVIAMDGSSYPGNWTSALAIQNNDNTRLLWMSPLDSLDSSRKPNANARIRAVNTGLDLYVGGTKDDAGNHAITLKPNGNVGIGTTDPLYRLHVKNSGNFGGENPDGTSLSGNVPLVLQSDGTVFGFLNKDSRQAFALNLEGNEGTTSARGYPVFYDKYDGSWHPSIYLRNGNVGIGLTPSVQKLEVNGCIGLHSRIYPGLLGTENGYSLVHFKNGTNANGGILRASQGSNDSGDAPLLFQASKFDFDGNMHVAGTLQVSNIGTPFREIQAGTETIGHNLNIYNTTASMTILFPNNFSNFPRVIATPRLETNKDNFFFVTIMDIEKGYFNICVKQANGNVWGEVLKLDWIAWVN